MVCPSNSAEVFSTLAGMAYSTMTPYKRELEEPECHSDLENYKGHSNRQGCSVMLIINQIGCHIITAVFSEISIVAQGILVIPLRKGGFRNVYGPNVV
jgi:hypothetical protein